MSIDIVKALSVCFIVLLSWCATMFCFALAFGWFSDDEIEIHDSKDGARR